MVMEYVGYGILMVMLGIAAAGFVGFYIDYRKEMKARGYRR